MRLRMWRIVLGGFEIGWGAQRAAVDDRSASEDPRRVARAALLIARAITPDGETAARESVRLLPDVEIIGADAASTVLAGMRKPLECEGAGKGSSNCGVPGFA